MTTKIVKSTAKGSLISYPVTPVPRVFKEYFEEYRKQDDHIYVKIEEAEEAECKTYTKKGIIKKQLTKLHTVY